MRIRIFDVEHGACALIESPNGRIALIDCGTNSSTGWTPVKFIKEKLGRSSVDYLVITNSDQDHYANLSLLRENISIRTFIKNPSINPVQFEALKSRTGPLSRDASAYKALLESHTHPVTEPFDDNMGGITMKTFWNKYPQFDEFNDLSLVAFIHYNGFQILFPGDLENPGWLALLQNAAFRDELNKTEILVASHHGRANGFCAEVFEHLSPRAVVVSDKPIVHSTQNVPQYQNCIVNDGVTVVGENRKRHVLTTRCDGSIRFDVSENGDFTIYKNEPVASQA